MSKKYHSHEKPTNEDTLEKRPSLSNEWKEISKVQQSGKTYLVTSDVTFEGVRAFWRKTRALSHNKWVLHGKWTEPLTNAEVLPQPLFYKVI